MEDAGLKFFGRMTAGVSHEIKNCLAIIGEQSGLMEDLMLMAEQGMPLDLQRFKKLSEGIARQVNRADQIVRRLNRFAHSVDEPYCVVEVNDTTALVVALTQRTAASKSVQLEADLAEAPVEVWSSPFLLEQAAFICMDSILRKTQNGGPLSVSVRDLGDAVEVSFTAPPGTPVASEDLPQSILARVLQQLEADVTVDGSSRRITLHLPRKISTSDAG